MTSKNMARLLFVLLLGGLSFLFLSHIDTTAAPKIDHLDKVVHFGAFFLLAWTFHKAFPLPVWLALVLLVGYGMTIEYLQSLLPYRSSSGADLVANFCGAASYYVIALGHYRYTRRRAQQAVQDADA